MKKYILLLTFIFTSLSILLAQDKFKKLTEYDIKGISINGKLVCPVNGFNHGTIEYGIYKERGFYFFIRMDNAVFGESDSLLETVSFKEFNDSKIKGIDCKLIDMGNKNITYDSRFWEEKGNRIIYLSSTTKIEGKNATMLYILSLKNSK